VFSDKSHGPTPTGVIGGILSRIKNPQSRALLLTNVFSHLRAVESCFFENETCMAAIATAMSEIEDLQNTPVDQLSASPEIPNDLARKFIQSKFISLFGVACLLTCYPDYYDSYSFEGFKIPLEKTFLLSIPDLLENPHIQLDYTSQIIYHALSLSGMVLDPSAHKENGGLIKHLYRKCLTLANCWLDYIQNTPADLFAAVIMVSTGTYLVFKPTRPNVLDINGPRELQQRTGLEDAWSCLQDRQGLGLFLHGRESRRDRCAAIALARIDN
jgi:hypothetical protein